MKKLGLILAAAFPLLFAACSEDNHNIPGEDDFVNVSFSTMLDQSAMTRGVTGESNGTKATKLYVAVYNASGNLISGISKIDNNTVTMDEKAASVSFQLVKGQTYNFAFWAQNPEATTGALTFDAAAKTVTVDYTKIKANDESLDAFTAHVNNLTVTGPVTQNVTLKRPWAQLNYGTTSADWDAAEDAGIIVTQSKVTVSNVYSTLNLLDGTVSDNTSTDIVLDAANIPTHTLTVSSTDYKQLGLNYLLVGNEGEQGLIKADLTVLNAAGEINTLAFSNIPVQRNYRTNIIGDLLTSAVNFNVNIDPMYEDDDKVVEAWDGVAVAPETTDPADNIIHITSAAELAWVSEQVAGGNTFAGKTVQLDADINLNNQAWTPIGADADDAAHAFQGTFDGNNKTISNLNVDLTAAPAYRSAGLFGAVRGSAVLKDFTVNGATVKNITTGSATDNGTAVVVGSLSYNETGGTISNVTVKNAVVEGNRYVGGIAGYGAGTITGCTVQGLTLTATPDNLTGSYDNGDKAGGIIGYINGAASITNNTVSDFTIKAYRDFGGIVGCGDLTTATVTGNSATNGTLTVDQFTNGYGTKTANAGAIVGRILGGSLDASNTSDEVVIGEVVAAGISRAGNIYTVTNTAVANTAIATVYTNAKNNSITDYTVNLPAGEFVLPSIVQQNITIRIAGAGDNTSLTVSGASQAYYGCTVDFSNLTLIGDTDTDFTKNHGLFHLAKETYTNVTFTKFRFFYAPECTLDNCKFVQDVYDYSFCAYGTTTMTLNNCEIQCVGKAAKIYGVDSTRQSTVTFNGCTFTCDASGTGRNDWKTAVEIDARLANNTPYTVNINNTVSCIGFYTSENTGIAKTDANYQGTLYNVDNGSGSKIVVNIDSVQQTQSW